MTPNVVRSGYFLAVAFAAVLFVIFFDQFRMSIEDEAHANLRLETSAITKQVRHNLEVAKEKVRDVIAYFIASQEVSEEEFRKYINASKFFPDQQQIRAVAVMPLLRISEVSSFSAALSQRALERDKLGYPATRVEPDPSREIYAPAVYAESPAGRQGIVGYDLASSPPRIKTGLKALAENKIFVTPPIRLSQDPNTSHPSVLVVGGYSRGNLGLRDYRGRDPDRPILVAVSYTPALAIKNIFKKGEKYFSELEIHDITDDDAIQVFSSHHSQSASPVVTDEINFGGRRWRIDYFESALFNQIKTPSWLVGVFAVGFGMFVALAFAIHRLINNAEELNVRVEVRTRELSAANERLKKLAEEAHTANRAKSDFLASMSHELRTPLNAILGFAQVLQHDKRNPLPSNQNGYVDNILVGGNHLLELVDEILDLAKVEADQLEIYLEAVDVGEIISECLQVTAPLCEENGVVLINEFGDASQTLIYIDPRRMKQILFNLLSNSVKFNRDDGTVWLRAETTDKSTFKISVQDTGIGIKPQDYPKVFQMFHRLDANPMTTREGTGIGLTVSKLLVEQMGGEIGFESEVDVGSTFWVEVPLAEATEAAQ